MKVYLTVCDHKEDVAMAIIFLSASLVGMKMLAGILYTVYTGGVV